MFCDVAFCIKKDHVENYLSSGMPLSNINPTDFASTEGIATKIEDGFAAVKWYAPREDFDSLIKWLAIIPNVDFLLIVLNKDQSHEVYGCWIDNPWGIKIWKSLSYDLHPEQDHWGQEDWGQEGKEEDNFLELGCCETPKG